MVVPRIASLCALLVLLAGCALFEEDTTSFRDGDPAHFPMDVGEGSGGKQLSCTGYREGDTTQFDYYDHWYGEYIAPDEETGTPGRFALNPAAAARARLCPPVEDSFEKWSLSESLKSLKAPVTTTARVVGRWVPRSGATPPVLSISCRSVATPVGEMTVQIDGLRTDAYDRGSDIAYSFDGGEQYYSYWDMTQTTATIRNEYAKAFLDGATAGTSLPDDLKIFASLAEVGVDADAEFDVSGWEKVIPQLSDECGW